MNEKNHADWHPDPVLERQVAKYYRFLRQRRHNNVLIVFSFIGHVLIGLYYGSWYAPALLLDTRWSLIVGAFSLPLLVIALLRRSAFRVQGPELRRAIRNEFQAVNGWSVEMSVWQSKAVTGSDVGMAWFEDGILYFVGYRTSFGIGTAALNGDPALDYDAPLDLPHVVINLKSDALLDPFSVGFRFIAPEIEFNDSDRFDSGVRAALEKWRTGNVIKIGQFPPLTPGPDLPS